MTIKTTFDDHDMPSGKYYKKRTVTEVDEPLWVNGFGNQEIERTGDGGIKITFNDEDEFGFESKTEVVMTAGDLQEIERLKNMGVI